MILSGNESLLFIKIGQNYVPIGCLTDNSFSESTELLPTTTQQSEGWRTARAGIQSYQINFTGLQFFSLLNSPNLISLDRLQLIKRNRTVVQWEEVRGNNLVQRGRGIIVELTAENPVNQDATFSGVIQGFGKPEMILQATVLEDGEANIVEDGNGNLITP
jgi:hypothetical protein